MFNFIKFFNMLIVSLFAFAGVSLLKLTLNQVVPTKCSLIIALRAMPFLALNTKFWLALGCYGVSLIVYLFLLRDNEVSKIFPSTVGLNILLTTLGAVIFLDETLTVRQIMGALFILTGVFFINEF